VEIAGETVSYLRRDIAARVHSVLMARSEPLRLPCHSVGGYRLDDGSTANLGIVPSNDLVDAQYRCPGPSDELAAGMYRHLIESQWVYRGRRRRRLRIGLTSATTTRS
jgi:hypothetical protein